MAEADQSGLLEAATKKVKEQAFYMKRSMDQSDLKQALHFAKEMLKELRSQELTPRNYYELYMKVLEELRYLEEFFFGLTRSGTLCSELYEQVQSCGMVLPRLYLLVTVGGVYIKSKQAPAKDILKDLVEMTKGVQHPMRGLFLRNYLSHAARELLPDIGSEYSDAGGGTVHDSLEFVITNFSETNRLWVRMQSQGANKDKKKREKERQDLRILVGTNLVRLSQLEGVDVNIYKENVLPRVLEQVANCKDAIAQAYLMDCITHVFPDDFHLETLELFLQTCTQLKDKVNVRSILENMMDRLSGGNNDMSNYENKNSSSSSIPIHINAFQLFNDCIKTLLEEKGNKLNLCEILKLHKALLNFALKCYSGNLDYVNHCLGQAVTVLNSKKNDDPLADDAAQEVESLLSIPLSSLALQVLSLSEYCDILAFLPWDSRKLVALELVRSIIQTSATLSDLSDVEKMFELITPLLKDDPNAVSEEDDNESTLATLEYEQLLVSRMVHLMKHEHTDEQFAIYLLARKQFGQGGVKRIKYTLMPLVFAALKLVQKVRKLEINNANAIAAHAAATSNILPSPTKDGGEDDGEEVSPPPPAPVMDAPPAPVPLSLKYSARKMFQFVHEIVGAMGSSGYPEVSLQLFLQCAMAADQCDFKAIAYEFISQASILYEDELTDSKAQVRALSTMVGTLLACRNFTQEDYDTLITKTTQYGAKLLKKPDQCRMVTLCSHLFWVGKQTDEQHYHDPRRVLECLQRSLKIADVCMSSSMHVHLFVEILNQYLYYFEKENEVITEKYISGLIALINEHIENMEQSEQRIEVEAHYKNTLIHIRGMQQNEKTKEKFKDIVIFQNKNQSAAGN